MKRVSVELIPRDEENGRLIKPNPFDNQFIATEPNMAEGAKNEIEVKQPDFPSEDYNNTLITALDFALQGLISPSTLGIDVKKLDNAEAQREKEKATLYTRGLIIEAMTSFLKVLVDSVFKANATYHKKPFEDMDIDVSFGEYANPSFEAIVETLSNPNTPMSIEAKVDEITQAALAEPLRNCDVGTVDEQDARLRKWCHHYCIDGTIDVPCAHPNMSCILCVLCWSQMPYEEGK